MKRLLLFVTAFTVFAAAAIAQEIAKLGGVTDEAYFVRGDGFADALAVSPYAWSLRTPVLLVKPGSVPGETSGVIESLDIAYGTIAGGTPSVSASTEAALETLLGHKLTRYAGINRYHTAALLADAHVKDMVSTYGWVGIATGRNFPDALGGGAAAGAHGGVLLLTAPASLSGETNAILSANKMLIDEVHIFGSTAAVSGLVESQIKAVLK